MLDFYTSKYPKARKNYKCDLCGGIIQCGEIYHRFSGKYDGQMFDDKYHTDCQDIINAYCQEEGENEYTNDSIYDWLHDKYCLDCKHHEDDDCVESVLSCPHIKSIMKKEMECE